MFSIILLIFALLFLIAEFWLGIAVIGLQGERMFLERSKAPGPYWMTMALHTAICIGLPTLAFMAGA